MGRVMENQNIPNIEKNKKFVYKRDKIHGVSLLVIEDNQEKFYDALDSIPKPDKVAFIESLFGVHLTHKELLDIAVGGVMCYAGKPWIDKFAMRTMLSIAPVEILPIVDDMMKKSAANLQDAAEALVYLMQPELPNIEELDFNIAELQAKIATESGLLQPARQKHKFYEYPQLHYINPRGYKDGFYDCVLHVRNR